MKKPKSTSRWFIIKILLIGAIALCIAIHLSLGSTISNNDEAKISASQKKRDLEVVATSHHSGTTQIFKEVQYYTVFSTSCSKFQDWQAMAFFHFAKKVKQPGNVTRLVSGCTAEEAKELTKNALLH
jgi:hypothetical protein